MEYLGGFIIMMCILSLFVVVVWLAMPLLVFAIRSRQDKTLEAVADIEKRLAAIEERLAKLEPVRQNAAASVESAQNESSTSEPVSQPEPQP